MSAIAGNATWVVVWNLCELAVRVRAEYVDLAVRIPVDEVGLSVSVEVTDPGPGGERDVGGRLELCELAVRVGAQLRRPRRSDTSRRGRPFRLPLKSPTPAQAGNATWVVVWNVELAVRVGAEYVDLAVRIPVDEVGLSVSVEVTDPGPGGERDVGGRLELCELAVRVRAEYVDLAVRIPVDEVGLSVSVEVTDPGPGGERDVGGRLELCETGRSRSSRVRRPRRSDTSRRGRPFRLR